MLWAALAYAAGIIAGAYLWRPTSWWVVAAIAFLAAGLYFVRKERWLAVPLALGAFFFAGALTFNCEGQPASSIPALTVSPTARRFR